MRFFRNFKIILQLVVPLALLFALLLTFIYISDVDSQYKKITYEKQIPLIGVIGKKNQDNTFDKNDVKVALALGGGGAKGFAHIGVIKVLQENNIPVEIVTGTSAGSVVGSLFASGLDYSSIKNILRDIGYYLTDFSFSSKGIIEGKKLSKLINDNIGNLPIEELSRKFGVVATNYSTGEATLLTSGDAGQAVRASSSIPAVFQPAEIQGKLYVDGGLTAPVPVTAARNMGADVVIAVDISARPEDSFYQTSNWFSNIDQGVNIMLNISLKKELESADVVIRPNLKSIPFINFSVMDPSIKAGEDAAKEALPQILEAIQRVKEKKLKQE